MDDGRLDGSARTPSVDPLDGRSLSAAHGAQRAPARCLRCWRCSTGGAGAAADSAAPAQLRAEVIESYPHDAAGVHAGAAPARRRTVREHRPLRSLERCARSSSPPARCCAASTCRPSCSARGWRWPARGWCSSPGARASRRPTTSPPWPERAVHLRRRRLGPVLRRHPVHPERRQPPAHLSRPDHLRRDPPARRHPCRAEPVTALNELECVGDVVYANIWMTDRIVEIAKLNGTRARHDRRRRPAPARRARRAAPRRDPQRHRPRPGRTAPSCSPASCGRSCSGSASSPNERALPEAWHQSHSRAQRPPAPHAKDPAMHRHFSHCQGKILD